MRVLYVGRDAGTSRHRFDALLRLGHTGTLVDPWARFLRSSILHRYVSATAAFGFETIIANDVLKAIGDRTHDLAIVDKGTLIGPGLVRKLRKKCGVVVNYNSDNPYTGRDKIFWRLLLAALPEYDLVMTRRDDVDRVKAHGARRVLHRFCTADEVVHRPMHLTETDRQRFEADVVFVGTWFSERGAFFAALIGKGVPIRIYGDRWDKAPEINSLRHAWAGPALHNDDYTKAILGAKVCLGLLYEEYEDLHTRRSLEIPSIGGLLCAKRTSEHMALYKDGSEAVFWDDVDECAELCLSLLKDENHRLKIAQAGHKRALANGHFNEPLMSTIIETAKDLPRQTIE